MATKIDTIRLGTSDYEIDLKSTATPSITSLTTSGNVGVGGDLTVTGTSNLTGVNINGTDISSLFALSDHDHNDIYYTEGEIDNKLADCLKFTNVDSSLNLDSTNPVQNKVITNSLNNLGSSISSLGSTLGNKANIDHTHSYSSLTSKPVRYEMTYSGGTLTITQVSEW